MYYICTQTHVCALWVTHCTLIKKTAYSKRACTHKSVLTLHLRTIYAQVTSVSKTINNFLHEFVHTVQTNLKLPYVMHSAFRKCKHTHLICMHNIFKKLFFNRHILKLFIYTFTNALVRCNVNDFDLPTYTVVESKLASVHVS